jgi:hypothetical protein
MNRPNSRDNFVHMYLEAIKRSYAFLGGSYQEHHVIAEKRKKKYLKCY